MIHPAIHYMVTQACARAVQSLINQGEIIMNGKPSDSMNHANGCSESPQPAAKTRYVRHISGQGEKWEVVEEVPRDIFPCRLAPDEWCVRAKNRQPMSIGDTYHFLPKSEYALVRPEKRWVDVTKDCEVEESPVKGIRIFHRGQDVAWTQGYQVRKVVKPIVKCGMLEDAAFFIVEHEEEVPDGV